MEKIIFLIETARFKERFNKFHTEVQNLNIFDVKSKKSLDYLLRNGYSYKQQEKKQYINKRTFASNKRASMDSLNIALQNEGPFTYNINKPEQKQLNISQSSQDLYKELFTDRFNKLSQRFYKPRNSSKDSGRQIISEEVKKKKIFNELEFNLNLKEMFQTLDEEDLKKLKKLHANYAAQKKQN